jgi:hypothetical protein
LKPKPDKKIYADFANKFKPDGCWYCGWREGQYDSGFFHVKLDISHIVGGAGRRKCDPRALNLLCSFPCHQLAHNATIKVDGKPLPKLTMANMLWLKRKFDPENYDPEWIASLWLGGMLPEPEEPAPIQW